MSSKQTLSQREETLPQTHAIRAAKILLGTATIITLVYGYFSLIQVKQWQMIAQTGTFFAYGLLALLGLLLAQRGRVNLAGWLLIGGLYVVFPVISVLVVGLGVVLGLSLALLTLVLATQILPRTQAGWAVFCGMIAAAITLLIDTTASLDYRLNVPQLQPLLAGITMVVVLIFVFYTVRQFVNYSLRAKLITSFLMVSLLSVVVVAFFSIRSTTAALTAETGRNLKDLADSQALSVGNLITRQIEVLLPLSLDINLIDRLRLANATYGHNSVEAAAILAQHEQKWQEDLAAGRGSLLQARLNNGISTELRKLQKLFPDHTQMMVSDKYGGLLAATHSIPDYDDSDEEWWQKSYNEGKGAIYVSQPTIDEDSPTYGIIICVPVYDNDGTVVGVLRSIYDITNLMQLVAASYNTDQGVQTTLLFPPGQVVDTSSRRLINVDPDLLTQLNKTLPQTFGEVTYNNQLQLASMSQVTEITGQPVIQELGWNYLVFQDSDKALAPVQTQSRNIILLAVVIAGAVIGIAIFMSDLVAKPIIRLTAVAQRLASGDLTSRAKVESGDEVGALAANFNSMADQLNATIDSLEDRVAERTQQLTTVVDVNQRLSSILDLSDLMRQVVTLTKETFNYYHVHIYLLDDQRETLIMAEGYGQAGSEMKRHGHSIPLAAPRSLVAQSAREGHVVIVENVRIDPHWLPNPLLPNTHSELAMPVLLDKEVVGVLDVQSETVGGLGADDSTLLQALANQIAIAVRNARIFSDTQNALYQAQKLQRMYTGEAWRQFSEVKPTDYEVRQAGLPPLEQILTPEVNVALEKQHTIDLHLAKTNGAAVAQPSSKEATTLATPLKLRGQIIGVLGLRDNNPDRHWTDDEIALIESVSEQMSLAIENARLFDETGRRAGREKIIADVTQQVWASGELEKVMQTTVERLGVTLNASKVVIQLGTAEQLLQQK